MECQLLRIQSCLQRAFSYCLPRINSFLNNPHPSTAPPHTGHSVLLCVVREVHSPVPQGTRISKLVFKLAPHRPLGKDWRLESPRGLRQVWPGMPLFIPARECRKEETGLKQVTWNSLFPNCRSGIILKELKSKSVGKSQCLKHPVWINEYRLCPAVSSFFFFFFWLGCGFPHSPAMLQTQQGLEVRS